MLRWGLGPALVSVYISYYLDRQTCHDLPVVDHSSATFVWRLMNCFGFAAVNVFLLLPQLLSIVAQPNARWDTAKLQFVAAGCVLYVALGLALAAQFALRKGTQPDPVADLSLRFGASPDRSLAQWVEDGSLPLGRVSSAAPASHVPGLAAGTRKPSTPKPRQANATRGGAYLGRPSQRTPPESRPLVLNEDYPRVPLALQQLRGTEAGNPSIAGALAGSATWYGLSDHAGQGYR